MRDKFSEETFNNHTGNGFADLIMSFKTMKRMRKTSKKAQLIHKRIKSALTHPISNSIVFTTRRM